MDPERETLQRHIAEVKRSLAARLDLLGGRVNRARRVLEIRKHVRAHLGGSLGAAAAIGVLFGLRARRRLSGRVDSVRPHGGIAGTVIGSLVRSLATSAAAALAAKLVRSHGDHNEPPLERGSSHSGGRTERPYS